MIVVPDYYADHVRPGRRTADLAAKLHCTTDAAVMVLYALGSDAKTARAHIRSASQEQFHLLSRAMSHIETRITVRRAIQQRQDQAASRPMSPTTSHPNPL